MQGLIDVPQLLTHLLAFVLMVWVLAKFAWKPLLASLEARRSAIAGEFAEAERRQSAADELKGRYEVELRTIEAHSRQRLQEVLAEGQHVASEIRAQATAEAQLRLERALDDIEREREKAKELLKEQTVSLAIHAAEKILRTKLDDAAHRKLAGEFIDEVGAQK